MLERIPSVVKSQDVARHLDAHLLEKLEVRRFGKGPTKPRGKKVPAEKSHSAETSSEEENSDELESDVQVEEDSDKQEEEEDSNMQEEDSDDSAIRPTSKRPRVVEDSDSETEELPDVDNRKNIGEYVVAVYEEQWFLAEIAKDQSGVGQRYTRLKYMTIKGSNASPGAMRMSTPPSVRTSSWGLSFQSWSAELK